MEAARIDGASEIQAFFRIIVPYIQGTLITVTTTILIFSLKLFDIVRGYDRRQLRYQCDRQRVLS